MLFLFEGTNLIKTALQTFKLRTALRTGGCVDCVGYKFVNWFLLNLSPQMAIRIYNCKLTSFAILTFVMIEEIASYLYFK